MKIGHLIFLLAIAFTCSLAGFVFAARQKGWPRGRIFEAGRIPGWISIGCLALLTGKLLEELFNGRHGVWMLVAAIFAFFIGGSILIWLLGRWGGMISLVAAPILSAMSGFYTW